MLLFLFVTEEISITVSRRAPDKEAWPSLYISLLFLLLGRRYHLTSIELWSAYFDLKTYTMLTHQQIPLLLAKSALSCWMYPTAQIALSPTPSHPWVPPEWPYCQQAQCGLWFTVKHSKAGLQLGWIWPIFVAFLEYKNINDKMGFTALCLS